MNDIKRILLPTGCSLGTDHALQHAVALARRAGATLHVLHVVERDKDEMLESALMEELFDAVGRTISRAERDMSGTETPDDVRVRCAVRADSDAARCIPEYVADYGIDLIVMSPFGSGNDGEFRPGSTAEKVTRLAPCDVLTTGLGLTDLPGTARRIQTPSPAPPTCSESMRIYSPRTKTREMPLTAMPSVP